MKKSRRRVDVVDAFKDARLCAFIIDFGIDVIPGVGLPVAP
jgi:hypothetical protein